MDNTRFDALTRSLAAPAPRRVMLRLLAGGLLGALVSPRVARAQRLDSDGDLLFDDDEVNEYGTKPDVPDTDGDGVADGEEIFNRDQGLGGNTNPLVNENAAPADGGGAPPAATCIPLGVYCSYNDLPCCGNDPAGTGYNTVICCPDAFGSGFCTDLGDRFLCPDPVVPPTGCPVGMTNCGGFCTDLGIDHGNCGVCGQRCSQVGVGYNCTNGACLPA